MMNVEEVQDIIVQELQHEFPRLTLETICDIADIIGNGWDWEEESLPYMKKYIQTGIGLYDEKEFISCDDELYEKSLKDKEMVMDTYIGLLQDKYECVCWEGTLYKRTDDNCDLDETETIYIWCD